MAPYVMPSPLALGGLGRLQCASTDRLALLSKPKARPVSHQRLPTLSSAGTRSKTARGEERTPRWAGMPCTAPGAPHSHGFSMHYRRLEHSQRASVPSETLVPKPPSNPRLRLVPLRLASPNELRSRKRRTPRHEIDWATVHGGRLVSGTPGRQPDTTKHPSQPSAPVSANWKKIQIFEQIRVLSKAKTESEKWDAVLKPWLAKYYSSQHKLPPVSVSLWFSVMQKMYSAQI